MNKAQKKSKCSQKLVGTSKHSGPDNFDNIAMSKQLKTKKQARGRIKKTSIKKTMNNKRLCTREQPMPTFKDLEKMFEDPASSQTAPDVTNNSHDSSPNSTDANNLLEENTINNNKDERKDDFISNTDNSPENIVEIHNKTNSAIPTISATETVMPKVIDCNEIITIDDDEPEINAQARKRKINPPKNNSILKLEVLDREKPQKVRKLENLNLTKTYDSGSDSDVTVVYDLEAPPLVSPIISTSPFKRFSPLPSTSTDCATILKNDKIFMESLSTSTSIIETEVNTDITINQEITVVIDDDYNDLPPVCTKNTSKIETGCLVIDIDDVTTSTSNDIIDDIDIDEIIASNRSILTKYKTVENLPEVIEVAPVKNIIISNVMQVADSSEISETAFANIHTTNQRIRSTTNAVDSSRTSATISNNMNATISNCSTSNNLNVTHSHTTSINYTDNNSLNAASNNVLHGISTRQTNNLTPNSSIHNSIDNSLQRPEVSTNLNCPICLDNLRSTECASTLCGHIFCMGCIKRAIRSSRRCPTCRKTIKGNNGYHRLFL